MASPADPPLRVLETSRRRLILEDRPWVPGIILTLAMLFSLWLTPAKPGFTNQQSA